MELTAKTFEKLLRSHKTVMIEFWGSWCPPCQRMKDVLDNLEERFNEKVTIAKINIDRNPSISSKYNICGVPTYIIFHNGEIIHREVGAKSPEQLKKMLEKVI